MPILVSEIRVGAVYEGGPTMKRRTVVGAIYAPFMPRVVEWVWDGDSWPNLSTREAFARWATKEVVDAE